MSIDQRGSQEPRETTLSHSPEGMGLLFQGGRADTRELLLGRSQTTRYVDLRTLDAQNLVESLSGALLNSSASRVNLLALEESLLGAEGGISPIVLLAVKNAISRERLLSQSEPAHLSVVVAMFKEHNRMLSRAEHEHGEDLIRMKARQLDWLTRGTRVTWSLHFVDDGCPERSGERAKEIIAHSGIAQASVSFLQEGIEQGDPAARDLRTVDDSQKGGSILYGIGLAARVPRNGRHVVVYTDADLSTDLRQTGNLVEEILSGERMAAAATRHARGACFYVGPTGSRANAPTKGFTTYRGFVREKLLPALTGVTDTQAGFKALDVHLARDISENVSEKGFPFDVEILLRLRLLHRGGFCEVPIVWGDSPEETTTGSLSSQTNQLKGAARIYRKYGDRMGNRTPEHDQLAELILQMDQRLYESVVMERLTYIGEQVLNGVPASTFANDLAGIAALGVPA